MGESMKTAEQAILDAYKARTYRTIITAFDSMTAIEQILSRIKITKEIARHLKFEPHSAPLTDDDRRTYLALAQILTPDAVLFDLAPGTALNDAKLTRILLSKAPYLKTETLYAKCLEAVRARKTDVALAIFDVLETRELSGQDFYRLYIAGYKSEFGARVFDTLVRFRMIANIIATAMAGETDLHYVFMDKVKALDMKTLEEIVEEI